MRHWFIFLLILVTTIHPDAQAQWRVEPFGGYARTFKLSNIDGGLEVGAGIFFSFPSLTVGLEASSYYLGDNRETLTFRNVFPPFDLVTRRSEEERSGFRVMAIAQKPLRNVIAIRGGFGYYGHTAERSSQECDSTGAVIEPRVVTEDHARGPGGLVGVGFNVLSPSDRITLRLYVDSHFMFVKSTSGIDGYGFFYYVNGGVRLSVRF